MLVAIVFTGFQSCLFTGLPNSVQGKFSKVDTIIVDTIIYRDFCFEFSEDLLLQEFEKFYVFADSLILNDPIGDKRFIPFFSIDFAQRSVNNKDSVFVEFYASRDYSLDFNHEELLGEIDIGRSSVSALMNYGNRLVKLSANPTKTRSELEELAFEILEDSCAANLYNYRSSSDNASALPILIDGGIYRGVMFSHKWNKADILYTTVPTVDFPRD